MLEVKGFRGLRFVPEKAGSFDTVITPPWDVISPAQRAALAAGSRYNMARLILPEAEGDLAPEAVAARDLDAWLAEGALEQDASDGFYLLEQEFADMDGYIHIRRGFFGVTRIPEAGERLVLGHERTFRGPVENRIRLTRATRANLGPVFVLYADPENVLASFLGQTDLRPPDILAHTIDGVTQRVWCVPYDATVTEFFRDKTLYIADGHHRYRTAEAYRDEMRAQERPDDLRPYDYVLMGYVAFRDPGLMIYPPHRLVGTPEGFSPSRFIKKLERWFEVHFVEGDLPARVKSEPGCAIGLGIDGIGQYLLVLRDIDRAEFLGDDHGPAWRNLDVAILHRGIIERILGLPQDTQFVYEHDAESALESVKRGDHDLAFLLKTIQSEQVAACAEAGDPMPQKATYFFPKLPSGAVIHRLD